MKRIRIIPLICALLLPLLVGAISAAISAKGMAEYAQMNKPPLSPPALIFPIAWTILYLMMGMASYLVYTSDWNLSDQLIALLFYAVQLAFNFMWSIIFFNGRMYLLAFAWLVILLILVAICTFLFYEVNRLAAYLMIPYVVWLIFAGYLNLGTYVLNRA